MDFYKLAIKEIKRETKNTVSIVFNIPQELKSAYQFIAGQYVTLKLTLDGKELRRAYSICSSPKSDEMRIAVKEVKNGTFSKFANTKLAVGDLLEVSIPEGKFTIAKSVLEEEPNSTFVLIYGNKDESETIFHEELKALQLKNLGRFFVHFVYSQANITGELSGRIDKNVVNTVLKTKHSDKTFSKFYLCGPEAMIQLVTATLKENNVAEKDIKFELFGTSSASEKKVDAVNDGHTNISINVDADEVTFEMSQKQTILEAAIKQGIDVPYSCQGGICSSCICRVTEGSATMKKNQILTDNEVAEGLVLACQAVPTSSEIKIDFDDI